jgi:hypothetical protein
LANFLFPASVLWAALAGGAHTQLNLELYQQKLLAGTQKENSQIFYDDLLAALPSSMFLTKESCKKSV